MSKDTKLRHEQFYEDIIADAQGMLQSLEDEQKRVASEKAEGIPAVFPAKLKGLRAGLRRFLHRSTPESVIPIATVKNTPKPKGKAAAAAKEAQSSDVTAAAFAEFSIEQKRAFAKVQKIDGADSPELSEDELDQMVESAMGWDAERQRKELRKDIGALKRAELEGVIEVLGLEVADGDKVEDLKAKVSDAADHDYEAVRTAIDEAQS